LDRSPWWTQIKTWRAKSEDRTILEAELPAPLAAQVIDQIWEGTAGQAYIVTDVGQHQMFAAQYYSHDHPYTRATSGGLGTMGFGLPAAIGTSFHVKDREIWAIIGNGGIQMTINELATAVQEQANINICIINNGYLGMVRQWQQMFYDSRYVQTPISGPDFVKVAEAYGMPGYRVDKLEDVIPTMRRAQAYQGPVLIEFVVESIDNVYPLVPAGADLHHMIQRPQPEVAAG
jgi:acetolactate synthase-1/2/3 large subunit